MFGNLTKASESRDCYPCPKNTFSSQPGSKACRPCGSSAYAEGRAAKCDCIGQNRMFSLSDGSCYCKSGFIYYDDVDVKKEEGNSDKDCQRIVSIINSSQRAPSDVDHGQVNLTIASWHPPN